jgi:hypothetical protein
MGPRMRFFAPALLACLVVPQLAMAQQPAAAPAKPATAAPPTSAPATPAAPAAKPATPPAPAIDPQAIAALTRMGTFLRTLQKMAIKEQHMTDQVLESGQKIQVQGAAELKIQRPNRLRVDATSDDNSRQFVYDGKSFTIFAPRERYYSTVPAPATLSELVDLLTRRYDIELPLADLFYWGTEKNGVSDVRAAMNVGPSTVEGVLCDHFAFRQADTDWQVWIQRGAQPLPRKLVVTTTDEPAQPQHVVLMTWDLSPRFEEREFQFVPPKDAHKIELRVFDATAKRQGRTVRPKQ